MSLSFPILFTAVPLYAMSTSSLQKALDESGGNESHDGAIDVQDLQKHWFSDGGISSNFPIQFFDRWLPTRPTFGVNLTTLPGSAFADSGDAGEPNGTPPDEIDLRLKKLSARDYGTSRAFVAATVDKAGPTDQTNKTVSHRHVRSAYLTPAGPSLQGDTPRAVQNVDFPSIGLREDIVQRYAVGHAIDADVPGTLRSYGSPNGDVYLPDPRDSAMVSWTPLETTDAKGEAGASLFLFLSSIFNTAQNYRDNMQSALPSYRERIVQVRLAKDEGGLNLAMSKEMIEHISMKGGHAADAISEFQLEAHQWIRLRVLMQNLEKNVEGLRTTLALPEYRKLWEEQSQETLPFRMKVAALDTVKKYVQGVNDGIEQWETEVFQEGCPVPPPLLRLTPEL
jgi:hypothetical protein